MSRLPWAALLVATLLTSAVVGRGEDPPAGPYVGPQASIWNRVHRALFHRIGADGSLHGARALDPLLFSSSTWPLREPRASEIESALVTLLATRAAIGGEERVARAILQRDSWALYDWLGSRAQEDATNPADRAACERLRARLAAAMRAVALAPDELDELEVSLAAARARNDDDLKQLLDAKAEGAWVRLAPDPVEATPLAQAHSLHFGARSAFSVHLRTPGGREETLLYLARLGSAELTVRVDGELRLAPRLPQPPVGTRVALVRRAMHVDRDGGLHVLPLVESVQLRAFPRTEPPDLARRDGQFLDMEPYDGAFWRPFQEVRELDLDRAGLLAGGSGLREVGPDEAHLSSFASHGEDPLDDAHVPAHPRLQGCVGCHGASGMHSVISFTRVSSGPGNHLDAQLIEPPRKLVADSIDSWRTSALAAARAQPQFALLLAEWQRKREDGGAARER